MFIPIDTHTHTVSGGHAFSTLEELAAAAAKKNLSAIALTEHGPAMPGGPQAFYFRNFAILPEKIQGVRIIRGVEVNIMDYTGAIDLEEPYFANLEFAIASLHSVCLAHGTREQNTTAALAALENKLIDVIGHPGNPSYPLDKEALVLAAKRLGKPIEINNHSFEYRKGSKPHCAEFVRLCKAHEVPILLSSDAHISYDVGNFAEAIAVLKELRFPQELILNGETSRFYAYLEARKQRLGK